MAATTVADLFRDGPICIKILEVHGVGKRVQVGVDAPLELRVLRGGIGQYIKIPGVGGSARVSR